MINDEQVKRCDATVVRELAVARARDRSMRREVAKIGFSLQSISRRSDFDSKQEGPFFRWMKGTDADGLTRNQFSRLIVHLHQNGVFERLAVAGMIDRTLDQKRALSRLRARICAGRSKPQHMAADRT